ncbi:ATP-binding cassette domain-containing protein, partial [bacterium]|nr:ATP-binding cassette domain-containing protein [bacterium]
GKSTLVSLLLRFIEPTSGSITINHEPLTRISLEDWRSLVAWVPQSPYLFHDTLAANLRLARPNATNADLEAAIHLAHLDEFIAGLPQGYETVVGEGGARLSGGQAQRLALARAFLKDAPILVLDEPTSSLDPEQETLVEASVRELMEGHTVITIAHRLNTVFQADRIVVLEGGRIVEIGSHQDLLALGGVYTRLVGASGGLDVLAEPKQKNKEILDEAGAPNQPSQTINNSPSTVLHNPPSILRLLAFLRGAWGWVALSVLLGVLTVGSNVGLMATSSYLISAAALHPDLSTLQIAIVGVRFFGISRGVFRYAERLVSHDVTFRLLARLRTWFYRALEPLAPARLMQYRAGDLLNRIIADVQTLENFYVRVVSPPMVAVLIAAGMTFFFSRFDAILAWVYLGFMLLLGIGVPLLSSTLSHNTGADLVTRRAELQTRLVDGIQGLADLLAFGRGVDYRLRLMEDGAAYGRVQRKLAALTGIHTGLTVLLVNLGMLTVLALSIPLVSSGALDGVVLAVLALAALSGFEAVMPLPLAAQTMSASMESAKRLFEVVDAPTIIREPLVESG